MRLLVAILAFSLATFAEAKTLIVTHADLRYDEAGVAGPATRALFEDPSFNRKMLLVTDGGDQRYTFDLKGLPLTTIYSRSGELQWDDSDTDLTVGGGYFDACFYTTVWQLLLSSKQNQSIRIEMKAVYTFMTFFSSDDDALANALVDANEYWGPPKTLAKAEAALAKVNRKDAFLKSLRKFLQGMNRAETRGVNVILKLRGKVVDEFGRGRARVVQIDFN
jgi:hypothetical protein